MTVGYARVVCCDSTIPGEAGGELSDPDWLDGRTAVTHFRPVGEAALNAR